MTDPIASAVFGMLFEYSTEALFIVDRKTGLIVSANVRVAELLACDIDGVIGARFDQMSVEVGRDLSAPGHYEDVALRRADDYPVFVTLFSAHVELPPSLELSAITARDTTERRQLEREIAAKHTALVAAYAELERRNREIAMLAWRAAVGELVAGMAHHLNNPVGALASTLRRLTTIVESCAATERDDLLRLLGRSSKIARRIESNVDAIARASRNTGTEPPPTSGHPVELSAVLATFAHRLDTIPTKETT